MAIEVFLRGENQTGIFCEKKSCPASFQLKPAFQSFSILATFLLFEIVCQQRNLAATLIFNFRQFQFNSKNSKLSAAKVQSVKDLNMFEK